MEIAHDAHHANDVSYFANMIAINQTSEDFHSDEVTELNKSVDDYTIKMEIAHDAHHTDDVSYFAKMIAIKQKRILHQPAEDFHSDEVTELNKSVDDYAIKM
ncbi:hypothetical protein SARC_04512 [Sphaeroforma arctica JP610]|uniref:Uncharacterized protein n=1 Tax=Sphaeroforma arctica JP610 TaxID=667725 RepID=A0A0L0G310_9EUKA|nr:hypothetical protein SARC_04512 [Sphaeroforma arctica JP610]KNC83234.1 hypothetical protein SARC_04512 [Sphaeroforma arctica JP610]|eukprot:XP_014157136.1 hypothetical protein SARC_04512 [Sphaeroforma arctica JP610]